MNQQPVNFSDTPANPIPQPVEDVQKTADRIREENESEVYVSLH